MQVLIVDDQSPIRYTLKCVLQLQRPDIVVREAADGMAALREVAHNGPDMVLADISMPGMSGIDMISALRGDHPRLPIIALSMHNDPKVVERTMAAGASGFVLKEHAFRDLCAAIDSVMAGAIFCSRELPQALCSSGATGTGSLSAPAP